MPRNIYDWVEIQRYHDEGHNFVECRRRFGFSHTAWVKALKRGQVRSTPSLFHDRRRRYDWAQIQAYYDQGHSFRRCQKRFGFCAMAWDKARIRGEIKTRPPGMPVETLLQGRRNRTHIKVRLLKAGLLENRCSECGLTEWRGKFLSIQIDHINGVRDDNRLENLRMLCPNCHSQTHTWSGRNMKRRRRRIAPR